MTDHASGIGFQPTAEGIKRYPESAGYYRDGPDPEDHYPCTCEPECPRPCKGQCGCEACHCGYQDFLSCE